MTPKSKAETAETDNGTPPETDGGAGTDTNDAPTETDGSDGNGSEPNEEDGRLKKLRSDLDAKTRRIAELEKAEADRQREEMSELDRLKADVAARDTELAELKAAALRSSIAAKAGLSADLAERLRGNTEDELREDAEKLAALVPGKQQPPAADDAGIGGKNDPSLSDPVAMHRAATAGQSI